MSWNKNSRHIVEIEFDLEGFGVGKHNITGGAGQITNIPANALIYYVDFQVVDAIHSQSDSATLLWGVNNDNDLISGSTARAVTALTKGAYFKSTAIDRLHTTASHPFTVNVATQALTAGRAKFITEFRVLN